MKYFKLDKDKREIIIDKYKKYNVNIDILDLIIDLQQEIDRLNNIIDDLEKVKKVYDIKYRENKALKEQVLLYKIVLDKIKQYCDDEKEDLIAGAEVCEDVLKIIKEIE